MSPTRMSEVELVDEVDGPVPTASAPRPGGSWRGRRAGRHALWLVATAALAVLGLVGTQTVLDARERSRLEALAAIPGVIRPTSPDMGVIWRAPPALSSVLQSGAMVGGLLVGGAPTATGVEVVALDPDTGATRWATPVTMPAEHAQPGGGAPSSWVTCTQIPHGGRPLAACVSQEYRDNVLGLPDSTVWVLDGSDGHVLSTRTLPGSSGVTFTHDAVVVAPRVDDTGAPARFDATSVRWSVTATDSLDGTRLWSYTTRPVEVLSPQDVRRTAHATGGATLQTSGDQVVLSVDTNAWVFDDDGTLVRDLPLEPGAWIDGARAGAYLTSSYTAAGRYVGTLLLADGAQVQLDQTAAWLPVDDGSAPDVVLTAGVDPSGALGLSGRDAHTGALLWGRPGAVAAALLLHGVVYSPRPTRSARSTPGPGACTGPPRSTSRPASSRPTGSTCSCPASRSRWPRTRSPTAGARGRRTWTTP